MAESIIRERIQRFAQLRAAQRAVARCVNPALISPVREQGRQLLIQLQSLSEDSDQESSLEDPLGERSEALAQVDQLLAHQAGMTLEVVDDLEFAQLRAEGPTLCAKYSDEVRALIDVMLAGDLTREKHLRLLEYLITMLSTQEWKGRRRVVEEPSSLTPGLRKATQEREAGGNALSAAADTVFTNAMSTLIHDEQRHALRDEIRAYKQSLGAHILHPHILARAVTYNVAMWNQAAADVDGSMAIDQLADELLADLQEAAALEDESGVAAAVSTQSLSSAAFTRLVTAFRQRICDGESNDVAAVRIVARFNLDGLSPLEITAFEADGGEPVNELVRSAVVLGQTIRHQSELRGPLESLGLDPLLLATESLQELIEEMSSASRRLFGESCYDEAFELSEVKTRNLSALAAGPQRPEAAVDAGERVAVGRGWRVAGLRMPSGVGRLAGPLIFLAFCALIFLSLPDVENGSVARETLLEISPFLVRGHVWNDPEGQRFAGELSPAWDYVATPERRTVVAGIGAHFHAQGIENVVLQGRTAIVLARYQNREVTEVAPKP